jgi:hypothetical protein
MADSTSVRTISRRLVSSGVPSRSTSVNRSTTRLLWVVDRTRFEGDARRQAGRRPHRPAILAEDRVDRRFAGNERRQ